jgi:RND superfamily putative drug exporter
VLAVDPEDMAARNTVDWMRAAPEDGCQRRDHLGGRPTALIKDFDDRCRRRSRWWRPSR